MKTALLILVCAVASAGCTCCKPAEPDAQGKHTLVQFSRTDGLQGWAIEDDDVMGGRSKGRVTLNEAGNLLFTGQISLENNGGFSSVQAGFDPVDISAFRTIHLGLKGDGKRYQIRVESDPGARFGYAYPFETSGNWEVIRVPFDEMFAIRHGDRLDKPNYSGQKLSHIQILIGNEKAESFELEIDRIWLQQP